MVGGDATGRQIVVLAGRGGNGGGGLAAARRLFGWGAAVTVVLAQSQNEMRGVPRQQVTILEWIGVPVGPASSGLCDLCTGADLVIDALIGYSLRGAPAGAVAALIQVANASGRPMLALDLPSGLDGDSGEGVDVVAAIREGLLVLFQEGSPSGNEQVAKFDQFLTEASRRRSGPMRILAEGLANYQTVGSIAEHLAVEHQLGALFKRFPVVTICPYDVRAFDGVTIIEALKLTPTSLGLESVTG
jgi:hydroxyethylthiazole kinase-like uncharacterized protein yjeF